jgi:hypothetical protein
VELRARYGLDAKGIVATVKNSLVKIELVSKVK